MNSEETKLVSKNIGHRIITKLCKDRDIQAEIYITESKETNILVSNQKVEDCKIANNQGIGLRVLSGGKWGNSYTSRLNDAEIDTMINRALDNVKMTTTDDYNRLPAFPRSEISPKANDKAKGYLSDDIHIYDSKLNKISLDEKIKQVFLMEKIALSYDKRVKNVPYAFYADTEFEIIIINSLGINISYQGTGCSISLSALAEGNGQTQSGDEFSVRRFYDELKIEEIANLAGWRAVRLLGAKPVQTQKTTIILDNSVACEFLGLIANGLCADSVQRGKSLFKNKIHKKVASSLINIQDDGTLFGGIETSIFDDEGVPSQKTLLVKEGMLQGYLYDTYTAGKDQVCSTGNAKRGSFKDSPAVGISNFFVEKGQNKKEDLIKETRQGFYIMEIMGMHMADPISGDFSVGASGLWIRNGEFAEPVQGVTIAGNIIDLLNSIDGLGDDLKFYDNIGSPTIRVSDIMVSGT